MAESTIQALLSRAIAAQSRGDNNLALELCNRAIEAAPEAPQAHLQLGRLEMGAGRHRQALRHLREAQRLKPDEPVIWVSLLDALLALKDIKAAKSLLGRARAAKLPAELLRELELRIKAAQGLKLRAFDQAEFDKAVKLLRTGKAPQAEAAALALLRRLPNTPQFMLLLALAQLSQRKTNAAEKSLRAVLSLAPNNLDARFNYGALLTAQNRLTEARPHLETAVFWDPASARINRALGILDLREGKYANAARRLHLARSEFSADIETLLALSDAMRGLGDFAEALELVEKGLAQQPDGFALRFAKARLLADLNAPEALDYSETLYQEQSDNADTLDLLTWNLRTRGDFERITALAEEKFENGSTDGKLFYRYARAGKLTADNPHMARLKDVYAAEQENAGSRTLLAYGLGKAHEDAGEYAAAFAYFDDANALQRERAPGSEQAFSRRIEQLRALGEQGLPDVAKPPAPAAQPIFICGMPRSGTSLVEQIVTSHTDVASGEEVGAMRQALHERLLACNAAARPLHSTDLEAARDKALGHYTALADGKARVTDKDVGTYENIGLFKHLLPEAPIVVVRRDPRDTCLSMYKNMFRDGTHSYTTDLELLGKCYLKYQETLDYWRSELPDALYEIGYEDLIANPDEKTRALIDACGLEWDDACLQFHKNTRPVRSLSVYQVRQPLYASSIGIWKRYADELQPLIRILDEGGALEGW